MSTNISTLKYFFFLFLLYLQLRDIIAVKNVSNLHTSSISESIDWTSDHVHHSNKEFTSFLGKKFRSLNPQQRLAVTDCLQLLESTVDELKIAQSSISAGDVHEIQTFLSAAMTNQDTCLDGLELAGNRFLPNRLKYGIDKISRMVGKSLAMTKKLPKIEEVKPIVQEEALERYGIIRDGFPTWVSREDRRYLNDPIHNIKIDLMVSKDGTGDFTTITDAVAAAPNESESRFVIYIKEGGYFENVDVGSNKYNLMFIGDGMWKTTVKSDLNVVDGSTTFASATVGE